MSKRSKQLQKRIADTMARMEKIGSVPIGVIDDDTPDEIVEAFLDEIEGCPLCRELEERARKGGS